MGPALLEAPILEAAGTREPREESGSFLRGLLPPNRRPWEAQCGLSWECSELFSSLS